MNDSKSKFPDLKELGAMTGKLFRDIKASITSIICDYKKTQDAATTKTSTPKPAAKEPKKAAPKASTAKKETVKKEKAPVRSKTTKTTEKKKASE